MVRRVSGRWKVQDASAEAGRLDGWHHEDRSETDQRRSVHGEVDSISSPERVDVQGMFLSDDELRESTQELSRSLHQNHSISLELPR